MREKILLSGNSKFQFSYALLENPCELSTEFSMPTTRETSKIFNPVVFFNSIDMVNNMSFRDSTIGLFPNISVLINMLMLNGNNHITASGFFPSAPSPEGSKFPYTTFLKSYITLLAAFRMFSYQLTTLTRLIVWATRKTFLAMSRPQLKRFITVSTYLNHKNSISCLRSIVKEVTHA